MFQNVNDTLRGDHHENFQEVAKSAEGGCRICIELKREQNDDDFIPNGPHLQYEFDATFGDDREGHWAIAIASQLGSVPFYKSIHVYVDKDDAMPAPENYQSFLDSVKEDLGSSPWNALRDESHIREIPTSTGGDASMRIARDWLNDCKKNHKTCENVYAHRRAEWYPKRLIAVEGHDSQVRLLESTKEQIIRGYATLSHVWGTTPFTTLTSDNYELLKSNIEISTIPRSFREAILACRNLSIEYLWIDSLCIVQSGDGSEEDWLTHATEMQSIYQRLQNDVL